MAKMYGIEGFCYYHYWFAGKRLLERPFQEVLTSGEPDFPFCLCWANETWSGIWHGDPGRILMEQSYPGIEDHRAHFRTLLPAFRDSRYIQVDGKPIFLIYRPEKLPQSQETLALWRSMADEVGLCGLHIVGMSASGAWCPQDHGFDAKLQLPLVPGRSWISRRHPVKWLQQRWEISRRLPKIYEYSKLMAEQVTAEHLPSTSYPCVVHAWDNTPRSGHNGVVFRGTSPETFRVFLKAALNTVQTKPSDHRLVFLKSWNEWAEGNHLEPDLKNGHSYLRVVSDELKNLRDK